MSENDTKCKGLKSFVKKHISIKTIWFIGVFIFVSIQLKNHWNECLVLIPISGYSVFFFAFIIMLFYPLFDTIKISRDGIEVKKPLNHEIEIQAIERRLEANLKNYAVNMFNQIKSNQPNNRVQHIKKQQSDGVFAHVMTDQQSDDESETRERERQSDTISFFENADTLKTSLMKKYENIISRKYNKNSMYNALNKVYVIGIDKMDDSLTEDEFKTWADNSLQIIEPVDKTEKTNLYENYSSLAECLMNTALPPYQKLNSCIDYSLDIMKYIAEMKARSKT